MNKKSIFFSVMFICFALIYYPYKISQNMKTVFHIFQNQILQISDTFFRSSQVAYAENANVQNATSQASLYKNILNSGVDIRTGQFSLSVPLVKLAGLGMGTNFVFTLSYSQGSCINASGNFDVLNPICVAKSWQFVLPYIEGDVFYSATGQRMPFQDDNAPVQEFSYLKKLKNMSFQRQTFLQYKVKDIQIFVSRDVETHKISHALIQYADNHYETFSKVPGTPIIALDSISYKNFKVKFYYEGSRLRGLQDNLGRHIFFHNEVLTTNVLDENELGEKEEQIILETLMGHLVSMRWNHSAKKIDFDYVSPLSNFFHFGVKNWQVAGGFLNKIRFQNGLTTRIDYDEISALDFQHKLVHVPVVKKYEQFAENDGHFHKYISKSYQFQAHNNYTGYPIYSLGDKNFFNDRSVFYYKTIERDDGGSLPLSTEYLFNHKNLMLRKVLYSTKNGQKRILRSQVNSYCTDKNGVIIDPKFDTNKLVESQLLCDKIPSELDGNYTKVKEQRTRVYGIENRSFTTFKKNFYNDSGALTLSLDHLNRSKYYFFGKNDFQMSVRPVQISTHFPSGVLRSEVWDWRTKNSRPLCLSAQKENCWQSTVPVQMISKKITYRNPQVSGGLWATHDHLLWSNVGSPLIEKFYDSGQDFSLLSCETCSLVLPYAETTQYPLGSSLRSPLRVVTSSGSFHKNVFPKSSQHVEFHYDLTNENKNLIVEQNNSVTLSTQEESFPSVSRNIYATRTGHLLQSDDAQGKHRRISYDIFGRPVTDRIYSRSFTHQLAQKNTKYDDKNNRVYTKDELTGLAMRWDYDPLGRVVKKWSNRGDSQEYQEQEMTYDGHGNLISNIVFQNSNEQGAAVQVQGIETKTTYDWRHRPVTVIHPNGITESFYYDDVWKNAEGIWSSLVIRVPKSQTPIQTHSFRSPSETQQANPLITVEEMSLDTGHKTGLYEFKNQTFAQNNNNVDVIKTIEDGIAQKKYLTFRKQYFDEEGRLIKVLSTSHSSRYQENQRADFYQYDDLNRTTQHTTPQSIQFFHYDIENHPLCLAIGTDPAQDNCNLP